MYPKFTEAEWEHYARALYDDVDGKPVSQYDPAIRNNFDTQDDQSAPDLWPLFDQMHHIPMVVLRGELSDILAAGTLERMASEHPDLVPVTVPDVGHVPLMNEKVAQTAIDELLSCFL